MRTIESIKKLIIKKLELDLSVFFIYLPPKNPEIGKEGLF